MDIYVVQQGDSINSIAESYKVTIERLIKDNGLEYPYNLVVGQTIVITYPKLSHTVKQGDTLQSIADTYKVTLMQIFRNNPYLSDRDFIYPGETLVISYNTERSIIVNGFTYPFIKTETLKKTLPSLTYLTVFNYTTTEEGKIIPYYDDADIVQTSKDYGVKPLMLLSVLTPQGVPDIETAYKILLNADYLNMFINEFVSIMKNKGYLGINIIFNLLSTDNQLLYQNFVQKVSNRLQQEGLLFFVTVNYKEQMIKNKVSFEDIDYSKLSTYVDGFIFLKFVWSIIDIPPSPVININNLRALVASIGSGIPSDKIIIGNPVIGYDWQLPYLPNKSEVDTIPINSALSLAYETGTTIHFDDDSQTPYFYYRQFEIGYPFQHIVWFIDARSINAINKIIVDDKLNGNGIWNIMIYNQQLWTIINAEFDIVKLE